MSDQMMPVAVLVVAVAVQVSPAVLAAVAAMEPVAVLAAVAVPVPVAVLEPVVVLAAVAVLVPPAEQEYHMIHRKERPLESELHNLDNSSKIPPKNRWPNYTL